MSTLRAAPWWLVPNLLALDAPCVAAVWQRFLAAKLGHDMPIVATVCLFGAVWALYLFDRFLDGRRGAIEAERHLVAAYYPQPYAIGATVVGVTAFALSLELSDRTLLRGLLAALATCIYLALVHGLGVRAWRGAKELTVALGFAAGVTLALDESWLKLAPVAATFGGLCWFNCRLIDRWEALTPRPAWPDFGLAAAVLLTSLTLPTAIGVAVMSAVVILLILDATCWNRPRIARVLADAALLTPIVAWAIP